MAGHLLKSINPDETAGAPVPSNPVAAQISDTQRAFDELTGREPPLYAIPPGPAWLRPGTVTYINMAYSQTIVSAMIDAGFLLPVDRSDNGKVREAIMRLIDVMLRHHIASVVAKEDAAKKAADNSWAMLRIR
jgi:hypothetical protein